MAPISPTEAPRILLVEDSEDDALLLQCELRAALGAAAYRRVDNEEDLRAALAEDAWDLVICDHWLPGFDSRRALEVVKEMAPATPFVICSGHLDPERALAAMRDGAHDFIDKGDRARLVPVIQRELRNSRVNRDKAIAENSVVELSTIDRLTRLPNRDAFANHLDAALANPETLGEAPALLVLDIDRFRRVSETWGEESADLLIRDIANLLAEIGGRRSAVSRLAHDKFAIFLAGNLSRRTAVAFAGRLARRFEEGFHKPGGEVHFTLSTGVALYPDQGTDARRLIRNAESASAAVRAAGGNGMRTYDPRLNIEAARSLALENALRSAIDNEELTLAYQPFLDTKTGAICGAEALLRWEHPMLGPVPPSEFVALAEESGLIAELGQWALERAITDARSVRERGIDDFCVAVNVSPAQFRDPRLLAKVLSALERGGLPASALELEITETIAMEDSAHTVELLKGFREAGIRVALDDFGTGFSSLGYLKRFPFDVIKIDRCFVSGLPGGREDKAIIAAMAALANGLGITLHAEGIEDPTQLDWLRDHGCQRGQGYLFGVPASIGDLMRRLAPPVRAIA
jgi:diguanylate cyclase (GGDEF)-like protein